LNNAYSRSNSRLAQDRKKPYYT